MEELSYKAFKVLSALLEAKKPITTVEIASSTDFRRQTIEPYMTKNVVNELILEVGSDGHAWVINEKRRQEIVDSVATFSVRADKERKTLHVHLIDADSKIPNIALMKLSAFYKAQGVFVTMSKGNTLRFCDRAPDKMFISIIYKKNKHMFDALASSYPYTKIGIGGSGYDLKKVLPPEIENLKPDYSLYPDNDTSIGFSSRGCIRHCYYCIVPEKEGQFKRTQHPREWFNPEFKKITFLDSNILIDKEYFFEVTDWCIENGLKIDFQSGYDIRLMDLEVAKRLRAMKKFKMLSFAWDNVKDEEHVLETIDFLKEAGFTKSDLRSMVQFYVYVDNDIEFDSGLYRCLKLRELGVNAFVMFNIDNALTDRIHKLQQWANKSENYWSGSPESKKLLIELRLKGDEAFKILMGDCAETLKSIPDESVDLIVTDPPYGYEFMGLDWDKALPSIESLKECLRVLKSGAFGFFMCTPRQDMLARMICKLQDAGFNINFSSIYWVYMTGLPHGANISKLVDKRAGVEREVVGVRTKLQSYGHENSDWQHNCYGKDTDRGGVQLITAPATPEAKELAGSYAGCSLKPATEVIIVAMRPLSEPTYIDQALKNKKGITWLVDCKIPWDNKHSNVAQQEGNENYDFADGRFPANILVSDDALNNGIETKSQYGNVVHDIGSYSRYFDLDAWYENFVSQLPQEFIDQLEYETKSIYPFMVVPKPKDREKSKYAENKHLTVKPLKLMSYLITMGSREGDLVLDPFAGSGTTLEAANMLKRRFIGCELDEKWKPLIEARAYMRSFNKDKYETYDDFGEEDKIINNIEEVETLSESTMKSDKMAI